MAQIAAHMIRAGPTEHTQETERRDIVIGFMSTIGKALCAIEYLPSIQV